MKRSLGIHSGWELGVLYMSSWVFNSWGRTDGWTKWIYKKMVISDKSKPCNCHCKSLTVNGSIIFVAKESLCLKVMVIVMKSESLN